MPEKRRAVNLIGNRIADFIVQLKLELSHDYLFYSIERGDRTMFEFARAGIWAIAVTLPLSLLINHHVHSTQSEFLAQGLNYTAPLILFACVLLVYQSQRIYALLSYFIFYCYSLVFWYLTLSQLNMHYDSNNYYIWLPITASSYFACVGVFLYFPVLTSLVILVNAVTILWLAYYFDPSSSQQAPAFAFFVLFVVAIFAFLLSVRNVFSSLSYEISNRAKREAKLLQMQSLLEIALKETRLGLIGFKSDGNSIVKTGYFPLQGLDKIQLHGAGALQEFEENLLKNYDLDFAKEDQIAVQIKQSEKHFLISRHVGEEMVVYTSYDITEREKSEAQMRSAQKLSLIGEITSGIAHDYNNILSIAMSNVEAFPCEDFPKLAHDYVNPTISALNHAKSVSRKLLTLAGRRDLQLSTIDVYRILDESRDLLRSAIGSACLFELEGGAGHYIKVDAEELKAAVINLIINAKNVVSDKRDGKISLSVTGDKSHVTLAVIDNGPGFTEEFAARIFDPFFTTKQGEYSTGLGLSMVKGFVKQSGGHVNASASNGLTRIEMSFPTAQVDNVPKAYEIELNAEKMRVAHVLPENCKILLVDDNRQLLDSLQRLIIARGAQCVATTSIAEANEIARSHPDIHFALLDYSMPEQTGVELGQALIEILPKTQFFILTGEVSEMISREALAVGFRSVILKPVKIDELFEILSFASDPVGAVN